MRFRRSLSNGLAASFANVFPTKEALKYFWAALVFNIIVCRIYDLKVSCLIKVLPRFSLHGKHKNVQVANACKTYPGVLFTARVMNRSWIIQSVIAVSSDSVQRSHFTHISAFCEFVFHCPMSQDTVSCASLFIYINYVEFLPCRELAGGPVLSRNTCSIN